MLRLLPALNFVFFAFSCLLFALPAKADTAEFDAWVNELKAEARGKGISGQTLANALDGVTFLPRVIELDRKQPEKTITFAEYRKGILSDWRIQKGRKLIKKHENQLKEVAAKYGVAPQYIVALWGIETSYGQYTGGFDVIPALATLAYDERRSAFFRKELLIALEILDDGHVDPKNMRGSWAGAMGQNQFMPSSFQNFAVDYNGDGRRDIWDTQMDVFASSANYLSKSGWREGERWGRPVRIPAGLSDDLITKDVQKMLRQWSDLGVRRFDGSPLPIVDGFSASLVAPDGREGDIFLIYNNYRTILKWNRSDYFAASVGLLADRIAVALSDS